MYSKFLNIPEEKQNRILAAAIEEFAEQGYDKASTNSIVKKANISKGLLFHYFKSKKDLYQYVYTYSFDIYLNDFWGQFDYRDKDVINRLSKSMIVKLKLVSQYPKLTDFVTSVMIEKNPEIQEMVDDSIYKLIKDEYGKLLEGYDKALFRDDIDIDKALQIIMMTFQGYSNLQINRRKYEESYEWHMEELIEEVEGYLEVLRKVLYK